MNEYNTILADPPRPLKPIGKFSKNKRPDKLPYKTMSIEDICSLPIKDLANEGCHLWLWTTNRFIKEAFIVMESWGAKYLNTITCVHPNGFGPYFVNTTEHLLMGYYNRCFFKQARYLPTHFLANRSKHSQKSERSYQIIESISPAPRVELFARRPRDGWDVWGNEVDVSSNLLQWQEKNLTLQ